MLYEAENNTQPGIQNEFLEFEETLGCKGEQAGDQNVNTMVLVVCC